jgi:hypothetical protein
MFQHLQRLCQRSNQESGETVFLDLRGCKFERGRWRLDPCCLHCLPHHTLLCSATRHPMFLRTQILWRVRIGGAPWANGAFEFFHSPACTHAEGRRGREEERERARDSERKREGHSSGARQNTFASHARPAALLFSRRLSLTQAFTRKARFICTRQAVLLYWSGRL